MLFRKLLIRCCCLFLLIILPFFLVGQTTTTDSLLQQLNAKIVDDTVRIRRTLQAADKLFFTEPRVVIDLLDSLDPIMNKATQKQQIDRWHYYGAAFQYLGRIDTVKHFHQQILANITREEDDRRYARALANLATVYRVKGELDQAAGMLEETLEIFEAKTDTFPKGTVRNSLGLIYTAQGDYQSAMKVFLQALTVFESVGHEGAQAIVLNNLGEVYQAQRDYARAIDHYRQYQRIGQKTGRPSDVATALNNIGAAYSDMNRLDSAEFYLNASVRVKEENNIDNTLSATLGNLAKVANLKGEYDQAIAYSERALTLARQQESKEDESYSLLELAKSYQQTGDNTLAQSYYQQALVLAEEMSDIKLLYRIHEGLYRTYRNFQPEQAISHLETAFTLKDSILNAENTEALTTLRLESEFNKKELVNQQKIETLELQEALQAAQLSNQRIAILMLIIGLLVLGYLLYKVVSQKNQIQQQNQTIQKALEEKDTLMREIHHRVKNNLQVISSLLGIQSRNVTDQVALDALNEGRSRVHTMSLIHQDLYQHDNLTGIRIQDYFEKLIQSLLNTYNVTSGQIAVETDVDDLTLDVDTVIPLGLIINELVSNSLKYAFPSGEGKIQVTLKEQTDGLLLSVADNGVGMTNPDISQHSSYGYELIQALVDKLEGSLEIDGQQGTQVTIVFREYQIAA